MTLAGLAQNVKHFLSMREENNELPVIVVDQTGRKWEVIGMNCSFSSYNIVVQRMPGWAE